MSKLRPESGLIVVVRCLVISGLGNVALLRRNDDDPINGGRFDLPGGEAEGCDLTVNHVIQRELWEETKTRVALTAFRAVRAVRPVLDEVRDGPRIRYARVVNVPGQPRIQHNPEEHQWGDWVPPQVAHDRLDPYSHWRKLLQACFDVDVNIAA